MLKAVFGALVGIFVVIVAIIVIPFPVSIRRRLFLSMAILSIVYFLLGLALILLTRKKKVKAKLKKYLMLTGICASGFLAGSVLHNLFYALAIITSRFVLLKHLMEILHTAFFLLATIICPIGFLIGTIGSIVLFIRKREQLKSALL